MLLMGNTGLWDNIDDDEILAQAHKASAQPGGWHRRLARSIVDTARSNRQLVNEDICVIAGLVRGGAPQNQ